MSLFQVLVLKHDERGKQYAKVLIDAATVDEASERGEEFARSAVFFGARAEHVEWLQTNGVKTPFVMAVDGPTKVMPKKGKKTKRSTNKPEGKS